MVYQSRRGFLVAAAAASAIATPAVAVAAVPAGGESSKKVARRLGESLAAVVPAEPAAFLALCERAGVGVTLNDDGAVALMSWSPSRVVDRDQYAFLDAWLTATENGVQDLAVYLAFKRTERVPA